ncbi:YdcF family protein [Weissella viridescens]|uniref:YdcF family protein n=1 Tax=Weissella viridescens TaxID=1629 RepID=A0A3P2RGZ0_WEIVI|nr:YdcF family protein [Weissella viridescens]RRG18815.1 YdcF family protein [Weissella viridescens]
MATSIIIILGLACSLGLSLIHHRVRLMNGVLAMLLLMMVMVSITAFSQRYFWINRFWLLGLTLAGCLLVLVSLWIGVQLLQTAWMTRHNHRYRLVNGTIAAMFISILVLIGLVALVIIKPMWWLQVIVVGLSFVTSYFVFWWLAYGIGFLIYKHQNQVVVTQQYILVLGAGLNYGNQVSLSLKARLDKALAVADKLDHPWLILSGGQGNDETLTEAEAMAAYCERKGYPQQNLVLEAASTSTAENMAFTKAWLVEQGITPTEGVFVTSDYHTYRAALLAQKVGVTTRSAGAKTEAKAFWHAYFREYCAIMFRYRWWHMLAILLGMILTGLIFVN